MLVLEGLQKHFGSTVAVDSLSLEIKKGQVLGLLGPNGAGKTTTMRMIVGYLEPDEGSIFLDDIDVLRQPERARQRIGYLPENNPLYRELLVSELLMSSGRLKGMTEAQIETSLRFVVPAVGLNEVFNKPIRELSKGFRQRVGIALALIHQPDVLILDEPTEGLDPNQRADIRALLRTLAKDRTVIISTHVLQEVSALCDRIVIIHHGAIVADGTEKTLLKSSKKTIQAELEGDKITSILRQQKTLDIISTKKTGKRVAVRLASTGKTAVQVELARLQQQHSFVIWSLTESDGNLEQLFKSVTESSKP